MDTAPAPDVDWKGMLLSKPAANIVLAMLVKYTKVDLPVVPMRVCFALAMLAHAVLLTMQLWAIRRSKEGPEVTVKELDMQDPKGCVVHCCARVWPQAGWSCVGVVGAILPLQPAPRVPLPQRSARPGLYVS